MVKKRVKTTKNTFNRSKANPSTSSKDVGEWNLVAFWFPIMEAPNPTKKSSSKEDFDMFSPSTGTCTFVFQILQFTADVQCPPPSPCTIARFRKVSKPIFLSILQGMNLGMCLG